MKTFLEVRKQSGGKTVYKSKEGKYPVEIVKDSKGFTAYVDGDKLDTFRSESDAKKGIKMAMKVL